MARQNTNATAEKKENSMIEVSSLYEIKNVHWTQDNSMAFFSLTLHTSNGDIAFNGVKLLYDKSGKGFIAPASYKGQNGQYYNHYYFRLAPEMEKEIISAVEAQ